MRGKIRLMLKNKFTRSKLFKMNYCSKEKFQLFFYLDHYEETKKISESFWDFLEQYFPNYVQWLENIPNDSDEEWQILYNLTQCFIKELEEKGFFFSFIH